MNAPQPGYWMGVLLGAAGVGAIAGLIPLFLGVRKNKTWLAIGGFLASVAGGLAAGAVGALLLAGFFSLLIRPWDGPECAPSQVGPGSAKGGTALGWYLVAMFLGQTVFLAVFWSLFMSLWLGKSFVSILVPAGAAFGLTMGIFIAVLMAVVLRPGTESFLVVDRANFLDRLERAAGKIRYRVSQTSDEAVVLEPKALFRSDATRITVILGTDGAVATGPTTALKNLKKAIERS
jgi:hypothetical protein